MSLKDLYLPLKARLESQVPELQMVSYFNNQFENSNHNEMALNVQQAIPYPCAFIEFPDDNECISSGSGVKKLDVLVRIHIGWQYYNSEPLEQFDLVDKIERAIEGYSLDSVFSYLTYQAQRPDSNTTNVSIHQLDYKTTFIDQTKLFAQNDVIVTGTGLNATVNLVDHL